MGAYSLLPRVKLLSGRTRGMKRCNTYCHFAAMHATSAHRLGEGSLTPHSSSQHAFGTYPHPVTLPILFSLFPLVKRSAFYYRTCSFLLWTTPSPLHLVYLLFNGIVFSLRNNDMAWNSCFKQSTLLSLQISNINTILEHSYKHSAIAAFLFPLHFFWSFYHTSSLFTGTLFLHRPDEDLTPEFCNRCTSFPLTLQSTTPRQCIGNCTDYVIFQFPKCFTNHIQR